MAKKLIRDEKGFLDLDRYFNYEKLDTLIAKRKISEFRYGNFKFKFESDNYYYKELLDEYWFELIVYHIAKLFNYNVALYDIVRFNNGYGVISKDFKAKDKIYISLYDLLGVYHQENPKDAYSDADTLENAVRVIKWYFGFNKNKKEMIETLTNELMEMMMLDILIGNSDRVFVNCMIEIDKEYRTAHIATLFDHEGAFGVDTGMGVKYTDVADYYEFDNVLRDLLEVCSKKNLWSYILGILQS